MPFPTSTAAIAAEEARLGCSLPDAFREYLLRTNGGEIEAADEVWQVYPVFDASDRKRAARSANHIAREAAVARSWPGFPAAAVAIGASGSGDLLLFMPHSSEPGALDATVYLWDHETGVSAPIAPDFSQLADPD